jgi:hypothetical protein
MPLKADWAYDFSCDRPLDAIGAVFNDAGPWQWQLRDSYVYGDYLNTRPARGVHLRVHEYPQAFIQGPREKGFSALLRIEADSLAEKVEIDAVFRGLLTRVMAEEITEIEPYD